MEPFTVASKPRCDLSVQSRKEISQGTWNLKVPAGKDLRVLGREPGQNFGDISHGCAFPPSTHMGYVRMYFSACICNKKALYSYPRNEQLGLTTERDTE